MAPGRVQSCLRFNAVNEQRFPFISVANCQNETIIVYAGCWTDILLDGDAAGCRKLKQHGLKMIGMSHMRRATHHERMKHTKQLFDM